MIYFKDCPRCHGDLYLKEDSFSKYLSCLQCGYLKDIEELASPNSDGGRKAVGTADRELQAA